METKSHDRNEMKRLGDVKIADTDAWICGEGEKTNGFREHIVMIVYLLNEQVALRTLTAVII